MSNRVKQSLSYGDGGEFGNLLPHQSADYGVPAHFVVDHLIGALNQRCEISLQLCPASECASDIVDAAVESLDLNAEPAIVVLWFPAEEKQRREADAALWVQKAEASEFDLGIDPLASQSGAQESAHVLLSEIGDRDVRDRHVFDWLGGSLADEAREFLAYEGSIGRPRPHEKPTIAGLHPALRDAVDPDPRDLVPVDLHNLCP
ncbi:MAG TPA: hypothetical protein VIM36_15085 [Gemmatimonadaceae bacterium]